MRDVFLCTSLSGKYMSVGLDDGSESIEKGLGGIELFVATVVDVVVWSGAARVVPWERWCGRTRRG